MRIGTVGGSPVTEGPLRAIDTSQLADGPYTLRLAVRASSGREDLVFRRFVVDNTPPAVAVAGLANGDERPAGVIELRAVWQDAGGLAAVGLRDERRAQSARCSAPRIACAGRRSRARTRCGRLATDRAGNQTASDPVTFRVR